MLRCSTNWGKKEWDFLKDCDTSIPGHPTIYGLSRNAFYPGNKREIYRVYSERHIPEENRAWFKTIRFIHYDRILAVDELGDFCNEGQHLLVDYIDGDNPFEPNFFFHIIEPTHRFLSKSMRPEKRSKVTFFPKKIPDERKIYSKELKDKLDKDKT